MRQAPVAIAVFAAEKMAERGSFSAGLQDYYDAMHGETRQAAGAMPFYLVSGSPLYGTAGAPMAGGEDAERGGPAAAGSAKTDPHRRPWEGSIMTPERIVVTPPVLFDAFRERRTARQTAGSTAASALDIALRHAARSSGEALMGFLEESWNAFSPDVASKYLKGFGAPSMESKILLAEVLREIGAGRRLNMIEMGCGNGQLAEYFLERGLDFTYLGVDFSLPLLDAARQAFVGHSGISFLQDDVQALANVTGSFDVAIYSHVLEMLSCPEAALANSRRVASKIVIRFFEPPEADPTMVELRDLNTGKQESKPMPYLRWTMGRDFYRLMLAQLGVARVDVYRSGDKDQVHVLHFD